jgi:acetylornithine deacetylase/succinyl-diaminopimelate desuccinylase-like protein
MTTNASVTLDRLITMTKQLVSFPTLSDDPNTLSLCISWVKNYILERVPNIHITEFQSAGKPSILFSHTRPYPKIMMCGHLDVVPPSTSSEEFQVQIDHKKCLIGRGVADMKGPIATLIDILVEEQIPYTGLLLTTDEEVGGVNGTGYVLSQLPYHPDVAILPDGGANMRLVETQKGFYILRLKAKNITAPSIIYQNPVLRLLFAHEMLSRIFDQAQSEGDGRVSMSLNMLDSLSDQSLNPGVKGSYPPEAQAIIDVRFPAQINRNDALLGFIEQILGGLNIQVMVESRSAAFTLNIQDITFEIFERVFKEEFKREVQLVDEAGGSDARYFQSIPVFIIQPRCGNWHSKGEWISINSLLDYRNLCARFARELSRRYEE